MHPGQEGVVLVELVGQCLGQGGDLLPESALGEVGQYRRVALAGDECFEHGPARGAVMSEATEDSVIPESSQELLQPSGFWHRRQGPREHVAPLHAVHWQPLVTELLRPSTDQLVEWGTQLLAPVVAAAQGGRPESSFSSSLFLATRSAYRPTGSRGGLLVVGSRRQGRLAGMLFGSVSQHLLTHTHRRTTVIVE